MGSAMTLPTLPFAHLNLRLNPFGDPGREERAELARPMLSREAMKDLVERLRRPGFVVQFIGEKGRGKSTHLFALHAEFPEAPYFHFKEGEPIPPIPDEPLVFLDEFQRVPRRLRKKLLRRKASWVIGSHEDHQAEYQRAGLAAQCHELQGHDAALLLRIFQARILWAVRDPDKAIPTIAEPAVDALMVRYQDDVRAMENCLYDIFQSMKEVCDVQV
jgi:hypothetical protein